MTKETFIPLMRQALVLADQAWFMADLAGWQPSFMVDEGGKIVSQYLVADGEREVTLVQRMVDGKMLYVARVDHWDYRSDEPEEYLGHGRGGHAGGGLPGALRAPAGGGGPR